MRQKCVSQVVSSLGILTVWYRKLLIKSWYNSKMFWEYWWLFICDFLYQIVPKPPKQNVPKPLDRKASTLFVSNMYNGNIVTFWYRKNYAWRLDKLKIFVNIVAFYCMIFRPNTLPRYPTITVHYSINNKLHHQRIRKVIKLSF